MKHKNVLISISYLITSVGILVLVGWIFNILILKAVLPGFETMKANTTLCFIALGVAFNLILKGKGRSIYLILVGFAFLVFLLSFLQDVFNVNIGIDELLIADKDNFLKNNSHPGRMAPTTSLCGFLIAISLLLLNNSRWKVFVQYLLHLISLITFIAIVGYFLSVPTLYKLYYLPSMPLHTALVLFVFSIAVSMFNLHLGITGLFMGERIGNQMARRLFPKMIFALFILIFLLIEAYRYQVVGVEFGTALLALSFSFVGLLLIGDTATLLNKIDHNRENEFKKAIKLQKRIAQFEDFNHIVAHNLRGPAGSIQMLLTLMSESYSDTEKSEFFVMLNQSSASLNETLNDLMNVLEVRNNNTLPYDNCDLMEIVTGVKAMLTGQIISKNAKIHTAFEAPTLKFPKIYLESIFYNMISNSLKYSRADITPEIKITSRFANDKVMLTFNDNGLGIDLIKHGDSMFKLNKIFHRGFDSKGVGLFMTKIQIETFGGSISVESEPNVGTTFTVEL